MNILKKRGTRRIEAHEEEGHDHGDLDPQYG